MRLGVSAVLAAVALALTAGGSPARAEVPTLFQASATAVGLAVQSTQQPAASVVTGGLVDASVAYATSSLSSGGSATSRAAAFYPGDLITAGPALLCSSFLPCPAAPPSYPLLADASYPSRPTATADPAAGTGAGSAQASAGPSDTAGSSQLAGGSAPAPVAVRVGSATSSTRSWADSSGAHAVAHSVLHDVSIGPLHLASVDCVDALDVSATGAVRDRPAVTLSGVTLAGVAAHIDNTGVHVAGQDVALPARQLAQQGLAVRLLDTGSTRTAGAGRGTAAGLLVTVVRPVSSVPPVPGLPSADRTYLGSLLVGGAGAAVAAATVAGFPSAAPPPPGPYGDALSAPPAASGGGGMLPAALAPPPAPGARVPPPAVAAAPRTAPAATTVSLADLMAALALTGLGLFAAWRAGTWWSWRRA